MALAHVVRKAGRVADDKGGHGFLVLLGNRAFPRFSDAAVSRRGDGKSIAERGAGSERPGGGMSAAQIVKTLDGARRALPVMSSASIAARRADFARKTEPTR